MRRLITASANDQIAIQWGKPGGNPPKWRSCGPIPFNTENGSVGAEMIDAIRSSTDFYPNLFQHWERPLAPHIVVSEFKNALSMNPHRAEIVRDVAFDLCRRHMVPVSIFDRNGTRFMDTIVSAMKVSRRIPTPP